MEILMALVILVVLIQSIVEGIKGALCKWDWIALALGAVLCPLAGVDAFAVLGLPLAIPYVSAVLSGLIVGRGAAFVFDLWDKVKGNSTAQ